MMDKNIQVIFFMRNEEGELYGINKTTSSSLEMYMESQTMNGIKFIKKVPGKVYPPSKIPEPQRFLENFNWRGDERIFTKEEIFRGKPEPILPIIKGIELPEDEGEFFNEVPEDGLEIPEYSKHKPKNLTTDPDAPKPLTREKESPPLKKKGAKGKGLLMEKEN
jgi:hypothetical protein